MRNRPIRRTLITDLDNCAFTANQEVNGKLLSRQFVEYAKKGKYADFYVCTHRSVTNVEANLVAPFLVLKENIAHINASDNPAKLRDAYRYAGLPFFTEEHLSHMFTHKIVEHLEQETGLSCVAVSTPDDNKVCGETYSEIIQRLEKKAMRLDYDFSIFAEVKGTVIDHASKNKQIMKIIEDALAKHPDEQHVFDFVDDRMDLCQAALALCNKLPKNVVLNVFHHDAFDSTPVKQINTSAKTQNQYCNFFTKAAVITTGIVAACVVATQTFKV
jgi:hypothetical protein